MELQLEALEALAATAPTEYLRRSPDGTSKLGQLYGLAVDAGLVPPTAADDIARLHSLFEMALDHGLGGIVLDYIELVCFDSSRTSSDPLEAFLQDWKCVQRWLHKLLAVARGRLSSWLARGLSATGCAAVLAKELGRLQMLQLVTAALQQPPAAAAAAAAAAEPAAAAGELAEAARLVQCAKVLAWLSQQGMAFDRATGRYFSEQEWRSVAAKRREGAAAAAAADSGLFLSDLAAELARHGIDTRAYPPPSVDRLLTSLFLSQPSGGGGGGGSRMTAGGRAGMAPAPPSSSASLAASDSSDSETVLHVKLALLAYYLADGGFMTAAAITSGLLAHFGVSPATTTGWLLQQQLDDAHTPDALGAVAMQRAADLVPGVAGGRLPHRVLRVFASGGRPDVALALLRQRPEAANTLEEARTGMRVRCQCFVLTEAFLGMKRYLEGAAAAAEAAAAATGQPAEAAAAAQAVAAEHAAELVGQMLRYASAVPMANGITTMHAAVRLPFEGCEEEAVVEWLEEAAASGHAAMALMLPLYFLLRGRTPEALLAYARLCPPAPASQQQADLADLLTEAARVLPAPQRALMVAVGGEDAAPSLLPVGEEGAEGGERQRGGVALTGSLPAVAADVAPAMLAVGSSPTTAPLVGSVPVILQRAQRAAAAAGAAGATGGGADHGAASWQQPGQEQQQQRAAPLLVFGQQQAQAQAAQGQAQRQRVMGRGGLGPADGEAVDMEQQQEEEEDMEEAEERSFARFGEVHGGGGGAGHELDRVLGLGAATGKGKRRHMPRGGSAYR